MNSSLTALLITPDANTRAVIEQCLRSALGLSVETRERFRSGDRFNSLENRPPVLMMIDASQSEYGALELLKEKRRSRSHNTIPVIVFAPAGKARENIHALQAGASAALESPIHEDELIGTVWWLLRDVLFSSLSKEEALIAALEVDSGEGAAEAAETPSSPPPAPPVSDDAPTPVKAAPPPEPAAPAESAAPAGLSHAQIEEKLELEPLPDKRPLRQTATQADSQAAAYLFTPAPAPAPSSAPAQPPAAPEWPHAPVAPGARPGEREAPSEEKTPEEPAAAEPAAKKAPLPAPPPQAAEAAEKEDSTAGGRLRLFGYEIRKVIGSGGMATVYLARQISLDRLVAIKVIARDLAESPEFSARFVREAKVQASLSHPHIVQVYELGSSGPLLYIVMEYIEGDALRDWIESGRLAPVHWAYVAHVFGEILTHLHARKIIHRDVKPANLLIGREGLVKLSDFGIVYRPEGIEAARLTAGRRGLGTPFFMAPEQKLKTVSADHRADIFSLAVTLHTMIVGGITKHPLPAAHLYRKELPGDVDRALRPALEIEPDRRPDDVREITEPFIEALCRHMRENLGQTIRREDLYHMAPFVSGESDSAAADGAP